MRKTLLLTTATLLTIFSFGQSVTETVNFDNYISANDNDYTKNFHFGVGISQVTSNGITGGALTLPNTINWGNANAVYCSKYSNHVGDTTITSICFKYNSALVNTNDNQRAASIWLSPKSDGNHYIIVTIQKDKKLGILSYAWNNNYNTNLNLIDNHWHKLQVSTNTVGGSFGDQIDIVATVYDLGTNGTSSPTIVNTSTGTIYDVTFAQDTAIEVSITGAKWGGSELLDDFFFKGAKSADSCNANLTGILSVSKSVSTVTSPNPFSNHLNFSLVDNERIIISLYDFIGQQVLQQTFTNSSTINTGQLADGIYFLQIADKQGNIIDTRKIIKQ